jgi:hypothetical protein
MLARHVGMKSNDNERQQTGAENRRPGLLHDFLSTEELAVELDVTPLTLVRWRMQKTGPPVTRLGRRILYRRSSLRTWLAAQEHRWA